MNNKVAIVTQSYKNDFDVCSLLCESIDRFAPSIKHFIFVNDEDYHMFQILNYGNHVVYKKSTVLPWYLIRIPWKIAGHHFHISLFTIPVREWIIQQICKLGVFEVIGKEYEAVFNIDSETVLMRPFNIDKLYNKGSYMMFRDEKEDEPSKDDYMKAAKKLLGLSDAEYNAVFKYNYMNTPVCFVRENTEHLLKVLKNNSLIGSWKQTLCNTYRFSEYYTYGIFTDKRYGLKNHYITDFHVFPQIEMSSCRTKNEFFDSIEKELEDDNVMGLWLQKKDRKNNSSNYLSFNVVQNCIREYWDK